ncbi:class I SAM-dependent methyltransferase [Magnetospirillum sp. ME-1]|uniref:class I SAM-dependent methyltransferase n=1 Tax=Magnetospirillum sp. ME-1 TaxID=1639348 RepID=UPI000A19436E|nr:methyltransferase domain-containing protein [Magnetospirillum sp. ME-1]
MDDNASEMTPLPAPLLEADAAGALVPLLLERLPPVTSVCDVGGGATALLAKLPKRKVKEQKVLAAGPEELAQPVKADRHYDLALCLAAADRIAPERTESLVAELAALADTVVMAATIPGQIDTGITNPRWHSFWVEAFAAHGFGADDSVREAIWNDGRIDLWCRQNLLVFRKGHASDRPPASFDRIHPDLYNAKLTQMVGLERDITRLKDHWLRRNQIMSPADVHWCRIVMNQETKKLVSQLDYACMSAVEVSGNGWQNFGFRDYAVAIYPQVDITKHVLRKGDGTGFDMVIAEQVLEHVPTPWVAIQCLYASLNEGGYLLVTTPFMFRVHADPSDYSRWTEMGLRNLLEAAGFRSEDIKTGSWGNRWCVIANFDQAAIYDPYSHSLQNEPDVPLMVWALARKQTA